MSVMWGWVSVYKDGRMNVGEYSKQKHDQRWAVTSNNPPAEVKTVMAMLDFMDELDFLKGGSNRSTNKHLTTYYIYHADLPKEKEET